MLIKKIAIILLSLLIHSQAKELTLNSKVTPFLKKYCVECHGGKKVKGKLDLTKIKTQQDLLKNYEVFESALELIHEKEMPPEDEVQPSKTEIKMFEAWYKHTFVNNVVAQAGPAKPRRLSVNEYKNTMRDLFGFDLEISFSAAEETVMETSLVKKLMPIDPPGESGFKNNTHATPLTTVIWNNYSYLADFALNEIFKETNRKFLEKFTGKINGKKITMTHAQNMIRKFMPMAYRRVVSKTEVNKTISELNPNSIVESLKNELKAVLMSPRFIFRGIMMTVKEGKQHRVDQFELAERLSYFIWGSMPDKRLLSLAYKRQLNNTKALAKEIDRMIADQRSRNLSEDFAYQWLAFKEMEHLGGRVPMMQSLQRQPEYFFDYLIKENRPLMELIDSKVAFSNPLTKNFYHKNDLKSMPAYRRQKGIEMEYVPHSKIILTDTKNRGGILTMPGLLAMNSSKGRTSPVLRGTWVLERILGDHLPEPPNVPVIPNNKRGEKLTFRQRFEKHRSDKTCAICHDKIDPLGFALESYDSAGNFREHMGGEKDRKTKKITPKTPIDASGKLYDDKFKDFVGLKKILLTKHKETIIRTIVRKSMSYALCRKLEVYDKEAVEKIVKQMVKTNGTYKELILAISVSMPFQEVYVPKEK